ncbi:ATP-binding cassette domain-containing protein [Streptomyces sp. ISL-1]|uniref:ABC transporter ATP-binding protein n=1 Tax=Streptomyces sp. ISL-1 TaxID=2817657 RepID=UPI001BE8DD41|nr:ABC transporter ATP-binding protein [Streptomyces sp. ISL-1]MBT2390038.1 ATP-binding cassette domain-containing protein [Streptomyces sp. ISL-1]
MPEKHAAAKDRSTVRSLLRLWPYVRPVRTRLFSAAFVAVVASCLGLVIPLVLKWIVDGPVAGRDPGGVWLGALALLLLGVAEAGLFGMRRWLVARPLAGVEAAMRADLYRHLQRLPVAFHDRWASGQLLSRGTTDLMLLRMFLAFPLTFLLVNAVTILVGFVILLDQQWTLGLVLLAPIVPLVILCSLFESRYAVVARLAQDQVGDLTTVVEESVLGIRIVKGFGRHRSQARAFRELSERLRGTELGKARLLAGIWALITTIPEVAIGAALVLGTVQVADGGLSAGTLVAFLSTALALRWPVESIGFLLAMSQEAATATERYFEVMDAAPESSRSGSADAAMSGATGVAGVARIAEAGATGAVGAVGATGGTEVADHARDAGAAEVGAAGATGVDEVARIAEVTAAGATGATGGREVADHARVAGAAEGLCFEGVEFRYPDAPAQSAPVLARIDLRVRPGETMALVGSTGSGKTTLTALVPRLHEVTAGRITLDGEDIAAMPRERLRRLVSVAFEEPTLFSASVGENVLMGAEDAGEPELGRALDIAQAGFVRALPHGADTQVGEQGLTLSGGQRQRLALARAVVGRPRFLVLDDPLSALDVHTEALVEAALRRVLEGTTALVVAHRPSTVMLADRVALLSGGRIAAVGTHRELLRTNAEYAWLMSGAEPGSQPRNGQSPRKAGPEAGTARSTAAEAGPEAGPKAGTARSTVAEAGPEAGTAPSTAAEAPRAVSGSGGTAIPTAAAATHEDDPAGPADGEAARLAGRDVADEALGRPEPRDGPSHGAAQLPAAPSSGHAEGSPR